MSRPFTSFPWAATNSPTGRTAPDRAAELWRSVKDFGALGIGAGNDDTASIQAAINQAITDGGGTVFFPSTTGSGYYNVTSPLTFSTGSNIQVELVGDPSLNNGSRIFSTFAGFVIDHPNSVAQVLRKVESLSISNFHSQGGGIRLQNCQTALIELCTITACLVGVQMDANAYCTQIRNSNISGSPASVGTVGNPGSLTGSISGSTLTVTAITGSLLQALTGGGSWNIFLQSVNGGQAVAAGTCIVAQLTGTPGGIGTYQVNIGQTVTSTSMTFYTPTVGIFAGQGSVDNSSITGWDEGMRVGNIGFRLSGSRLEVNQTGIRLGYDYTGAVSGANGVKIDSISTERNALAIDMGAVGGLSASACGVTGTIAPARSMPAATWSGGVATVTGVSLAGNPDSRGAWIGGTRSVQINHTESAMAPWDSGGYVTGTWISATSFSYPLASNPGIAYDGSSTWSFKIQTGIRIGNANNIQVAGVNISGDFENAGIDLFNGGLTSGADNVFSGVGVQNADPSPTFWLAPLGLSRASFQYQNCTNVPATGCMVLTFADLPGQPGVYKAVVEGLQYSISDGAKSGGGSLANLGDIAVGGGSQHAQVRWNGSAWTVTGL